MVRRPKLKLAAVVVACLPLFHHWAEPPTDERIAAFSRRVQEAGMSAKDSLLLPPLAAAARRPRSLPRA